MILYQAERLRRGRHSYPGVIYMVTTSTHQRQPICANWQIGRIVVNAMRKLNDEQIVQSIAWVVMPDHFHWLFRLQKSELASVMQQVKSRSALDINTQCFQQGRVWQSGYFDRAIRSQEDLRQVARYIIANPMRRGLVTRIGDYPLWDAIWL